MRQEIKVNLGNFSNVTLVSSEYDTKEDCRADLKLQLEDWIGVSGEAEIFYKIYFKGEVPSPMIKADTLPIEKKEPVKKPDAPKIEMGKVYDYMKKDGTPLTCDRCGGLISWDDRPQRVYPMHVDEEGHIVGDGDCPNFGGS